MELTGEKVLVVFDDGISASKKYGVVTDITSFSVFLDNKTIIPKRRIIRMEILEKIPTE